MSIRKRSFSFLLIIVLVFATIIPYHLDVTFATVNKFTAPQYTDKIFTMVNNNKPEFTKEQIDKAAKGYEKYSNLDSLGRCQTAMASIGIETMPTQERTDISAIHPSGWLSGQGWERCHLIAFCLTGENDNEKNLVTGTHSLNHEGMKPFEVKIANYVRDTKNHVLYRVTPVYTGKNLIPSGIHMEAYSVEDNGEGISFNIYVFNVEPGMLIDYVNGTVSKATLKTTSIKLNNKTIEYTGNQNFIGNAIVKGSSAKIYYTYFSDSLCTKKVTSRKKPGKYYVKATVSADSRYAGATSNVAILTVTKAKQNIWVKSLSTSFTDTAVSQAAKSFPLTITTTTGNKSCVKVAGNSTLSVTKDGKVKVKKGIKAGTYRIRIKITASQTANYKTTSIEKIITINIKKNTTTTSAQNSKKVYWTLAGKVYHKSSSCSSLVNSKNIYSGTVSQSGKSRACEKC